jgi:hypothetical protein
VYWEVFASSHNAFAELAVLAFRAFDHAWSAAADARLEDFEDIIDATLKKARNVKLLVVTAVRLNRSRVTDVSQVCNFAGVGLVGRRAHLCGAAAARRVGERRAAFSGA